MTDPRVAARRDPRPRVTVIVVAYNHSAYVVEALDSVLAQTARPHRIIVADDASTDDSVDLIRRWMEQHRDIDVRTVLHRTNTGLCTILNEALALVETPLYTYLSADDRMLPHRLEVQIDRWLGHDPRPPAVYSDALRIDELGQQLTPDYGTVNGWSQVSSFEGDVHAGLLKHNWIPAASVLLDTKAVRSVGGYNDAWFYEDHDLWLRLSATAPLAYVDEPLVEVRELATSLGSTGFGDDRPLHMAARLGILLDQVGVSPEGDDYIRDVAPHLAVLLWRTGERPDLVVRAFRLPGLPPSPRWTIRAALVRLGLNREPRLLHLAGRSSLLRLPRAGATR